METLTQQHRLRWSNLKTLQLTFTMWLVVLSMATAQSISELEYFFGADPGFGNGTMISANSNTSDLTQVLNLPLTGLDEGFQKLTIRALDEQGTWGVYQSASFYISDNSVSPDPISNIAGAEYWFDTDPGFGNGTALTITGSPSETTESYVIPLGTLSEGFHTLGIRVQNLDGDWSLSDKRVFFVTQEAGTADAIANISSAEYWFDTDPGFGNGNALTVTGTPDETTESYAIPLGTLDTGFHSIGVRAQNTDGIWSLYDRRVFYVFEELSSDPISNISGAEYWFDTDPGFGNGTALSISGNPNETTESYIIPISSLEPGFHKLGIRVQNNDGSWSLYDKRVFYIFDDEPTVAPITEMEFLYDAELGFGTGETAPVTATGNPNEYLVEIPTTMVTCDIHDLWVSLKNADGNYSLYNILVDVDVFDNQDPTIVVFPDITVELDALGQGSITIADVDNGTFDDCELVSVVLDQPQFNFTCADLGANTVTVTATDAENKVSTQEATITVVDTIDPVAVAQDITIMLDANGLASIVADDLENGSTDNCSIVSRSIDISDFDCSDLGANTVSYTVTDPDGNSNSVDATVTVIDDINPNAIAQDVTVQLDSSGNASIIADDIDLSTDNCSIVTKTLDIDSFDCSDIGVNTVTLTVTDQSGNSNSTTATITVEDNIDPTVITQNITVQLDASGNATILATDIDNSSTDNCTIASRSLDISTFDCSNIGDNSVTLSITDQSGNSNSAMATVTVEDNVNPIAIAQDITIELDASGNASITASDIDNGSSDNCGIDTTSLDITTFDCGDIGQNTVTLTVNDSSGNSNSTTATVTVEDNISPTVTSQNISIELDANGLATITTSDIENSISDNCGIASSSLDVTSFDCNDIGNNTVTLSVTDVNGNTTNVPATVTVEDVTNPVAVGQDLTIQLDANGNASITVADIENGSTDNCTIASSTLDIDSFDCNDVGMNPVTLTVTDQSGNSNATTVTVTIEDTISPNAIAQDITLSLNGAGIATIVPSDVDNGSNDNCSIASRSLDISSFDCSDIGTNPVNLTITDANGLSDSATAIVTVVDDLDPIVVGQDITVDLNGNSSVSIVASDVDNGSSDNCGSITLSIDVDTFFTVGDFPVVLTVTDDFGNEISTTVTVSVVDTLGIDDEQISPKDIKIYPNPVKDMLFIETDAIINEIRLYNVLGEQVLTTKTQTRSLNTASLSKGVYLLQFIINDSIYTKRFIKD